MRRSRLMFSGRDKVISSSHKSKIQLQAKERVIKQHFYKSICKTKDMYILENHVHARKSHDYQDILIMLAPEDYHLSFATF